MGQKLCFIYLPTYLPTYIGRAIAQAAIQRLPITPAHVRGQVTSCAICGRQSGTGIGFLRVRRFPLPILIPPTALHSSSIIRGWYNRPISGRRNKQVDSVSPHPKKLKKKLDYLPTYCSAALYWALAAFQFLNPIYNS
jgi:hypothetical protein